MIARVFYAAMRWLFYALAAFCGVVFGFYPRWGLAPLLVIGAVCLLMANEARP